MSNQQNFLEFSTIKNGIVRVYNKLISSDKLSEDLLNNNENYECYLINSFFNLKLRSDLQIDKNSNFLYSQATASMLVNDAQYCEKWLEIVKSYLYCIGIDVEKNDNSNKINIANVEKTKDKFQIIATSIKLVAQLALQNKNLGLYDQVFDIYCSLYEAFARNYNSFIEQALFALEDSTDLKNELVKNYQEFCAKYTENSHHGVFSDLEEQINEDILGNALQNNLDSEQIEDEDELDDFSEEEFAGHFDLNEYLKNIKNSLEANQNADFSNLPTVFADSVIADNFDENDLASQIDQEFKSNFLAIVELFSNKIGINLKTKAGLPIVSFINKKNLSEVISAIKLLASISQENDQEFFDDLQDCYQELYEKFTRVGLLDNEDGFSDAFYANEMADTNVANFYQSKSPQGVFFDIENNIDRSRYDQLIEQNIKKFDEKTLKFYQAPYIDIRLEQNAQNDYQVEVLFDGSKTSFEAVAQEFGQDPQTIKDWQKKVTDEGFAISFSHETVANYLGIRRGEELNQTLLTIRDQALEEKEMLYKSQTEEDEALDFSDDEDEVDDLIVENESHDEDFSEMNLTDSLSLTSPSSVTDKFDLNNQEEQDNAGVQAMYQFYLENTAKIERALANPSLKNLLNFIVLNPDIKVETTSNPTSNEERHQIKLVFRNGYTQKTVDTIAQFVTNGRKNEWQFSQSQEAQDRGFEGSFTIPHGNTANILGTKDTQQTNKAVLEVFDLVSNLELLNMVIIENIHNDKAYNLLAELIRYDFTIAFDYQDNENIFSAKNLVFVTQNQEEREYIYNFLGYGFEQNPQISRQDMENFRAQITDQNGDIIANSQICQALYEVKTDQEVDIINRKMESFLQANKMLCDAFNADEHLNLITLLNLNQANEDQDNEELEDYSDEEELESLYV
jgi:hypothetical protein